MNSGLDEVPWLRSLGRQCRLYAEGVRKNGWSEVVLLLFVLASLLLPRLPGWLQSALVKLISVCFTVALLDLYLRAVLNHRLRDTVTHHASPKLPRLPIVGRWDPNVFFTSRDTGTRPP